MPYVVEAWIDVPPATQTGQKEARGFRRISALVHVNKTPITAEVSAYRDTTDHSLSLHGCGLSHRFDVGRARPCAVWLNVQTPYMPLASDGKAPDLSVMIDTIAAAVQRAACTRAKRDAPRVQVAAQRTIAEITMALIPEGVRVMGGNRFNQRHLFYAVRTYLIKETGQQPKWARLRPS